MAKSVRSIDRMIIPKPCDADWDSMIGNDEVRFCEHCSLHVTDLSSLKRKDAMDLVARSQGRLCVRFIQKPNGEVLTRTRPEKLYRIQRRVSRIAASAFTATISVSSAIAQSQPASTESHPSHSVQLVQSDQQRRIVIDEFIANLSGFIRTEEEQVISQATVVLVDRETGEERNAVSSVSGHYFFEFLPQGEYVIWARKTGYTTETQTVKVPANESVNVDIQMTERAEAFLIMGGGAMAILMEPEDPLFKAISDNDVEKVRQLAPADLELNRSDRRRGMSLLTEAVQRGNKEVVAMLLALGADVNLRNGNGRTALMYLSENTTPEILRDLLSAGARLNAREDGGANPFMIAAASSPVRVLRDMIEAGAQVNARDSSGETCLFTAARTNSPEAIVLLLEAGVDPEVTNEDGETALMSMATYGSFENFQTLIDRGANRGLVNADGTTLLMLAATNDNPRLAKLLVAGGADVNAKDRRGNTALTLAAQDGQLETVKLLLAAGANLNSQDDSGYTALMRAVMRNDLDCVQALLEAGADLTKKNEDHKTALEIAREQSDSEIVKLLESRGAPD